MLEDLELEEEWDVEVLLVFKIRVYNIFFGGGIGFVAQHIWVTSKLPRERNWVRIGGQVHHVKQVLERKRHGYHQNKSDEELSLGSTQKVFEYEEQIDERENVGFENDRNHKYQQNDALKCELASLEERDFILPVDSLLENVFKLG
jgi:hypothetical protein